MSSLSPVPNKSHLARSSFKDQFMAMSGKFGASASTQSKSTHDDQNSQPKPNLEDPLQFSFSRPFYQPSSKKKPARRTPTHVRQGSGGSTGHMFKPSPKLDVKKSQVSESLDKLSIKEAIFFRPKQTSPHTRVNIQLPLNVINKNQQLYHQDTWRDRQVNKTVYIQQPVQRREPILTFVNRIQPANNRYTVYRIY